MFAIIGLVVAFFIGSAFVTGTPDSPKPSQTQETKIDLNKSQAAKPIELSVSPSVFKAQTAPNNPNIQLVKVITVIDGDTIEVDLGEGNIKRVRYIGIDTPESVDPRQPIQCFGKEATAKNEELVANGVVGLEKDVSDTDRYGRLLRYVYMGDLFLNQALVTEGYAKASSYPPDVKYQDKLRQSEQQARASNKGLWRSCNVAAPKLTSAPTVAPKPTTTSQSVSNSTNTNTSSEASGGACKYSCTGPDRDCSDFSSHSEAQSFFNCCGFSAANDPMRLDQATGQGNGLACENI
ncbi:MAG: thermonuclease family protein [Candidatus Levyibacteriota bacterium]